jgi:hypothetical protein
MSKKYHEGAGVPVRGMAENARDRMIARHVAAEWSRLDKASADARAPKQARPLTAEQARDLMVARMRSR